MKALVWVDDVMMRGIRARTDEVWKAMDVEFGLKVVEHLDLGVERTFLGVTLMKSSMNGGVLGLFKLVLCIR